jgi:hypothetical protein
MELVPFNPQWADSGSKLDLHAFYKGKPGDDRYVRLPVRRHNDWARKGLTYVTLASAEDVNKVVAELKAKGVNLSALADSYDHNGTGVFKIGAYAVDQPKRDADEAEQLRARLAQIDGKEAKKGSK